MLPDPLPSKREESNGKETKEIYEPSPSYREIDVEDIARPANTLNIHAEEHWGVVASTGGGKTTFVMKGLLEYLRRQYPHIPRYILDSTGDPKLVSMSYNPLVVEGNHPPDLLHSSDFTQIWRPRNSKLPLQYQQWFDMHNDTREPEIIVVDEIASITGKALGGLETLFKQKRKHGGVVVACSQRLAKVDTDIFSQLHHFAQFFINPQPYDLQLSRMYLMMPKEEQRQPLHPYGFFYRPTRSRQPYKEYRDYRHFFGSTIA